MILESRPGSIVITIDSREEYQYVHLICQDSFLDKFPCNESSSWMNLILFSEPLILCQLQSIYHWLFGTRNMWDLSFQNFNSFVARFFPLIFIYSRFFFSFIQISTIPALFGSFHFFQERELLLWICHELISLIAGGKRWTASENDNVDNCLVHLEDI
jgi:hypothetical protein